MGNPGFSLERLQGKDGEFSALVALATERISMELICPICDGKEIRGYKVCDKKGIWWHACCDCEKEKPVLNNPAFPEDEPIYSGWFNEIGHVETELKGKRMMAFVGEPITLP